MCLRRGENKIPFTLLPPFGIFLKMEVVQAGSQLGETLGYSETTQLQAE
jgi:hypothetical protein